VPPEVGGAARFLLPMALLLSALSPPFARSSFAALPTPQHLVEGRLMCYCGCSDLTVRVCTCGTADAIRAEIAGRLAGGESPEQVVAAFVARHGEQIRSAPLKSGFDLVAWVTPFAALILAASGLVVVIRRWGRARAAPATSPAPQVPGTDRAPTAEERRVLERVRREMREGR
jgi:cytochrome c-type biogenesis protein CcmH